MVLHVENGNLMTLYKCSLVDGVPLRRSTEDGMPGHQTMLYWLAVIRIEASVT